MAAALMLHELAMHARRFGAWTQAGGHVAIDWTLSEAASPEMVLTWREVGGGPSSTATQLEGYGLQLLQMLLPQQLGGTAAMRVEREGLVYALHVPTEDGLSMAARAVHVVDQHQSEQPTELELHPVVRVRSEFSMTHVSGIFSTCSTKAGRCLSRS